MIRHIREINDDIKKIGDGEEYYIAWQLFNQPVKTREKLTISAPKYRENLDRRTTDSVTVMYCDFFDLHLDETRLQDVNFVRCRFSKCTFENSYINMRCETTTFSNCKFINSSMNFFTANEHTIFEDCEFQNSEICNAAFCAVAFFNSRFIDCNLSLSAFFDTTFSNTRYSNDLDDPDPCLMTGIIGCDLSGARIYSVFMQDGKFLKNKTELTEFRDIVMHGSENDIFQHSAVTCTPRPLRLRPAE